MSLKEIYEDDFWDIVCSDQKLRVKKGASYISVVCQHKALHLSDGMSTVRLLMSIGAKVNLSLLRDAVEPISKNVTDGRNRIRGITARNCLRTPVALLESDVNIYGTLYWVTFHLSNCDVEYSFLLDFFVLAGIN